MNRVPRILATVLVWLAAVAVSVADEFAIDVRDCGAVGDGQTLCTAAIQKAVDQCAERGGGTVRLPAGRWLTGTVYLASDVTIELDKDSTLLGSQNHDDYAQPGAAVNSDDRQPPFRYAAILAGSDLRNVTIRGEGTIDGQGAAFRDKTKLRPKNIYLQRCKNVTVEGLRLRNAGCWMQHYRQCDGVTIRDIDVFNHVSFNNDGLNIDSCSNVLIENCRVDSDDDAIVLKSLSADPCRGAVIRHCTVSSHCNGIKLGTESQGGFQDIEITGCVVHSPKKSEMIYGRQRGLAAIALEIVDGGILSNVTVSDIRIEGVTVPIFLRLGNRARSYTPNGAKPGVGTFRDVALRDIVAENTGEVGCSITGLAGHPIREVLLENIKLGFDGGQPKELASRTVPERADAYPESVMFGTLPAYGFYCRHAEGLTFRNVELHTRQPDLRHAMVFENVQGLTIDSLNAAVAEGGVPALRMTDVDGAEIRDGQPAERDTRTIPLRSTGCQPVAVQSPERATYTNPIMDGTLADPAVILHDGVYYLYATGEVDGDNGYRVYTSTDLIRWKRGPVVFRPGQRHIWAPDVWRDPDTGRFYLYYTANKTVGVAEAAGPEGPFAITRKLVDQAIDAHLFRDDDGRLYLYYVTLPGFRITVQPMASPTEPAGDARVILQPESEWETRNGRVTEGPWIIKHDGRYYLLYSGSGADTPDYAVGYATSRSPLGPFVRADHNPILHRGDGVFGPGHGGAIQDAEGAWWYVYHQKNSDRRAWDRFICIDRLHFDEQGRLNGRATRAQPQPAPATGDPEGATTSL